MKTEPITTLQTYLDLPTETVQRLEREIDTSATCINEVVPLATLAETKPIYRPKLSKMLQQYSLAQTLIVYYLAGILPTAVSDQQTEEKYYHFFSDELHTTFVEQLGSVLKSN